MTAYKPPCLVAFTGRIRHGKTAAGHYLTAQHGFDRVSFADPLKKMLMVLGLTRAQLYDPVQKEQPCEVLLGQTPRWAMQTIGTNWARRYIHQDLWVEAARRDMREQLALGHKLVIDDLRFDNEAQVVHDLGGVVFHIVRPSLEAPWWKRWWQRLWQHPSERGISPDLVDVTLINDGSLNHLYDCVWDAITRPQSRPLAA